ncbi:MAG TPA: FMN-binding glutamate synthase family protein, partial [Salinimicrobium sp.]|nr:FMN-binding glutamate synthase family protein [Salinimicrobium sp.]
QGAKPGKGGVLPASKITPEIAEIRHVPLDLDVVSPPYHSAFSSMAELVDFLEDIARETGLPVGVKAAIGKTEQWKELAKIMKETNSGPDFISVDGGEGGTGAAPPSFADHVALPFINAFTDLYQIFLDQDLTDRIVFIASGKLGFPAKAIMAFAMGADCINVAREAMFSIGCIQAQQCHLNTCPSGVATQSKWLQAGINVKEKSERVNYYFTKFKKELLEITYACGYEHPCQFTMDDVDINLGDKNLTKTLAQTFFYNKAVVPFESTETLYNCEYLGATYRWNEKTRAKGEKTKTKEVETEETSATEPVETADSIKRKTEQTPAKKVAEETNAKTGTESKKPSDVAEEEKAKKKSEPKKEKNPKR